MRKRELKKRLNEAKATLDAMVKSHDLMVLAGSEQRLLLKELAGEKTIYERAFQIATGRLAAHQRMPIDEASTLATEILVEAAEQVSAGEQP
mgnify:CR=1 FL=1